MSIKRIQFMRKFLITLMLAVAGAAASQASFATVFTVDNTHVDLGDINPGDGKCEIGTFIPVGQRCTLRAAISEANAKSGADGIIVPAGAEIDLTRGALVITDAVSIGPPTAGSAHTLINNQSNDRDFKIRNIVGTVSLSELDIANGAAPNSDPRGGGILFDASPNGNLELFDCAFYANMADNGGAIFSDASITLLRVEIFGNFATSHGPGSAMTVDDQNAVGNVHVAIKDSSIHNNVTAGSGNYSTAALNFADLAGITIENTTISGNSKNALTVYRSPLTLRNVTLTDSPGVGLAYSNDVAGLPKVRLLNSIIAGNGANCSNFGSYEIDSEYNLFGANTCPGGFLPNLFNTDPKLGPLASRGTGLPLHELLAGSPAIDAGDPRQDANKTCTLADQDNRSRGYPATTTPERSGLRCDIGAAEFDDLIFRDGFQ